MAEKYHQIEDGVWQKLARKHRFMCCDCALVHDVEIRRNKDGTIDMKYTTNKRATAASRRTFGYRDT